MIINQSDSALVKRLIREGYERLAYHQHPDPYIVPYMPGGTSFMRNPAPPLELVYPDGIPEGVSRYESKHPQMKLNVIFFIAAG